MKYKESETIELKKSTSELKEAVISIAAILNKHQKGKLYFGIKNDGTIVGQQVSDATLRHVSHAITEHIEPKIYPSVTMEIIQKKPCVVVEFKGEDIPYFAYARSYMRVADEDRQLAIKELENLIARKNHYRSRWESQVSNTPVSAVNIPILRQFVKRSNDARRMNYRYDNARNVLKKLEMIKDDVLLNAGKVLFSSENSVEVQAAVFAGNDKLTFLDIQSFHGNLFELIKKSEQYIQEHINWRADLSGSRRLEIPEVPLRAITEAIINSLCHRDFANPKGNEVAIFKNRIEIYNPGRFPEDYSPQDFIKGKEHSILRNPLIANALYFTSDIERWGSGLKRISNECKATGVKVEFNKIKSGFAVIFHRSKIESGEEVVRKGGQIGGQKKWSEITGKQKAILELVIKNPVISRKNLSDVLDINPSAVQKHLQKLRRSGFLHRIGPDKGGHWEVKK